MENKIKYVVSAAAAAGFMSTAVYLPAETFLAIFAGGLFMIPAAFFIYMLQSVARD